MNVGLLKRLCETPGIPGHEDRILAVVHEELKQRVDEVRVDALGNLIGVRKGKGGPRVMLAAHVDEIGFLVKHIDDKGFIRLQTVGGWDPRQLVSQRVLVHGFAGNTLRGALQLAAKPIHLLSESEIKTPKIGDFFVDLGLPVEQVKEQVEVGDIVTMDRTLEDNGVTVMSKSLDDRVCVFIMLEALSALGETNAEIVAVATTQEEIGLRGAKTAAFSVEPDLAIGLDVTLAVDIPGGSPEDAVSKMGGGAAIKISDGSMIANPRVVRHMRDVAERHGIAYQLEVLPFGGQDGAAMQQARAGVPAGTISLPTRYVHTPNEMASKADIQACIDLLARFLEEAGSRTYLFEGV